MKTLSLAVLALALAPLAGCAPAVEPVRVRAAELSNKQLLEGAGQRPVVIEFQQGDTIPIDLSFSGDLLELTPATPPLAFRARERFFVRIDKGGLAVSRDGVHFGEKPKEPGSFRLGFSATDRGARVEVSIKSPTHARLGE